MADILKLVPPDYSEGAALDPDVILEAAKGKYTEVVVIGFDTDGNMSCHATHGSRQALWALRLAEQHLLEMG